MIAKEKEILRGLISENKCQFVIPVFQRNYDWREKDCKKLFNDVISLAVDTAHPARKHFLGAFVYKFKRVVETQFLEYILIDGQQRLTSVTLMLKALYDYLGTFGDQYEDLRLEIYETYLVNKFAKSTEYKLKLKPNEVDNDNYISLIEHEEEKIDTSSTIYRNYSSFYKWIEEMDVSVEAFFDALQRLEGVVVELDDGDNPQLIFESLNSTGLDLTDVDLIRNYLLMNCDPNKQTALYKEYWLKLEKLLGENFVVYVRDYLSFENGSVTPSSKNMVYDTFQKYFRALDMDTEEFLKEFLYKAGVYNRLLVAPEDKNTKLNRALSDFIELDMGTTFPFVFGLLLDNEPDEEGRKKINDSDLASLLRVLESYIIRRNVCNLSGGGLSQVMASLYKQLQANYKEALYANIIQIVSTALISITSKAYFPANDEFVRELTERDMYKNRNIDFILRRLETMTQEKEELPPDTSVEHVLPQTLSEEWIEYLGLSKEDLATLQREYTNRIGNLTLTAYNSEMRNKLYSEKKKHMDFSRLVLNQYFKDVPDWNQKEIEKRGKAIAKLALKIWPYPEVRETENLFKEGHFIFEEEDEFDFAGTTPSAVKVKEKDFLVTSWRDVFVDVLKAYYLEDKDLFVSLFSKPGLINPKRSLISKNKEELWIPVALADGYFVDVYVGGADRIIKLLRDAMTMLQADPSDVIVLFA